MFLLLVRLNTVLSSPPCFLSPILYLKFNLRGQITFNDCCYLYFFSKQKICTESGCLSLHWRVFIFYCKNIPQRNYSQFKVFLKEEITKEDIPQVKSFPPRRYSSKKKFPTAATLLHHSTKSESPSTSPDVCSIFNIHAHLRYHHSRSANHWWCLKRVQSFQNSPFAWFMSDLHPWRSSLLRVLAKLIQTIGSTNGFQASGHRPVQTKPKNWGWLQ